MLANSNSDNFHYGLIEIIGCRNPWKIMGGVEGEGGGRVFVLLNKHHSLF